MAAMSEERTYGIDPLHNGPRRLHMPVGLDLAGRSCLVIGGGESGTRKALMLAEFDAHITVVAPRITQLLHASLVDGEMDWIVAPYEPEVLDGAFLVVCATDDDALNHRVAADARTRNCLVCNVRDANDSDFVFAPHFVAGDATISVHGRNIHLAHELIERLAEYLQQNVGMVGR
jgi:siroheme synthase-like protein